MINMTSRRQTAGLETGTIRTWPKQGRRKGQALCGSQVDLVEKVHVVSIERNVRLHVDQSDDAEVTR